MQISILSPNLHGLEALESLHFRHKQRIATVLARDGDGLADVLRQVQRIGVDLRGLFAGFLNKIFVSDFGNDTSFAGCTNLLRLAWRAIDTAPSSRTTLCRRST